MKSRDRIRIFCFIGGLDILIYGCSIADLGLILLGGSFTFGILIDVAVA